MYDAILVGHVVVPARSEDAMAWYRGTFHRNEQGQLDIGERQVGRSTDPDVSTVFFCSPLGLSDAGDPLWFESRWRAADGDDDYRVYDTDDHARVGHDQIVAALRDGVDPQAVVTVGVPGSRRWGSDLSRRP